MQNRLLPCALLVLFIFPAVFLYAQSNTGLTKFHAGFKIIRAVDSSRNYKTGSDATDYLHYRPLDLDIWYPAQASSTASALTFQDFLGLLEQRANYYTASSASTGLTGQVAKSFAEGFGCSDSARILQFRTASFKNAEPAKGNFPLVVYLASYNGMAYENTRLFEALAQKGYIVVSISSIGRYPGDMTMKKEDLMEQVQDAAFAIELLSKQKDVSSGKIGIVGFSWGGLAGAMLASRFNSAACLVSLDGSEFHHYGDQKQENDDFNDLLNSPAFKAMHLSLSYLRLESDRVSNKQDSVYNFTQKLSKKGQVFTVHTATHQDFSYLPVLVNASGGCKDKEVYPTITALTIGFLEEHIGSKKVFSGVLKQALNQTVRRK